MTTTAEKIRDIQLELKRTENDLQEAIGVINALQIELTKIKQDTKSADPEPLECWVNVYPDIECTFWLTEEEADKYATTSLRLQKVHMRKVTPAGRARPQGCEAVSKSETGRFRSRI